MLGKVIPFLDILIDNHNNTLNTTTNHNLTYSGLVLNFNIFSCRIYKISLIKCLIDCAYETNNTRTNFHNDVTKTEEIIKRYFFPSFLIDKLTKYYLDKVHNNSDQFNPTSDKARFYKLSYIEKCSEQVQKKFPKICKQLCKDAFKYFLVYKFACARCNSRYIGKTCRHFKTRIYEHVKKDKNIYKHLHNNEGCFSSFNPDCFSILHYVPTQFQIKIKEGICID